MDLQRQAEKADKLRRLHASPPILILPNVWDVASARIIETAGFPAIATSSAAIAFSLGYPDGQRISRTEMLRVVKRIAEVADVPVTADLEAGYGRTPEAMTETVRMLVDSGAVGMNLEDVTGDDEFSQVPIALQVEKIHAVREAAAATGVRIVLNARTDIYLMPIGEAATRFERTVERLRAYRNAGADCVFAPGLRDGQTIGRLVKAVDVPLNILAGAGCPTIPELEKLGVARASLGSGVMRAAMESVRRFASELRERGTYTPLAEGAMPFRDLNCLFRNLPRSS